MFGFCTADFLFPLVYESVEPKPKHCLTWDFLSALLLSLVEMFMFKLTGQLVRSRVLEANSSHYAPLWHNCPFLLPMISHCIIELDIGRESSETSDWIRSKSTWINANAERWSRDCERNLFLTWEEIWCCPSGLSGIIWEADDGSQAAEY